MCHKTANWIDFIHCFIRTALFKKDLKSFPAEMLYRSILGFQKNFLMRKTHMRILTYF